MKFIGQTLLVIFRIVIFPIEAVIRVNMGERYASFFKALISIALLNVLSVLIGYEAAYGSDAGIAIVLIFNLVPLAAMVFKQRQIRRTYRDNEMMHSYYPGIPILHFILEEKFEKISESSVRKYWEPLALLVIGGIFLGITIALIEGNKDEILAYIGPTIFLYGIYNLGAGVVLFVTTQIEYSLARERFLDAQDQMIESKELQNALNPVDQEVDPVTFKQRKKNPYETSGFYIPGPVPSSKEVRTNVAKMYERLSPRYKNLMVTKKTPSREPQNGQLKGKDKEIVREK